MALTPTCVACRSTVRQVLAVHHVIPRAYGGTDDPANLTTLCANCHRLVHWLAVGRRHDTPDWEEIAALLGDHAATAIADLAGRIRKRRDKVSAANNRWIPEAAARGSVSLDNAITSILARNGYEGADAKALDRAVRRLIKATPRSVLAQSSVRLLGKGRYISVNAGNHLLFRLPAYSDGGSRQYADAFVIWPDDAGVSGWSEEELHSAEAFRFALVPCVNLAISSDEVLAFTGQDWACFREACEAALSIRTRSWPSNVIV